MQQPRVNPADGHHGEATQGTNASLDPSGAKAFSPAGFRFPLIYLCPGGMGWGGAFQERMGGFAHATHDVPSLLARSQSPSHFIGV